MKYELTAELMNEAWEEYKTTYGYEVTEHWSHSLGTELSVIRDFVEVLSYANGLSILLEIVEEEARLVLYLGDVGVICSRYWEWKILPDGLAGFHLVLSDIYRDINNALAQLEKGMK